jgi:hypothetical protein
MTYCTNSATRACVVSWDHIGASLLWALVLLLSLIALSVALHLAEHFSGTKIRVEFWNVAAVRARRPVTIVRNIIVDLIPGAFSTAVFMHRSAFLEVHGATRAFRAVWWAYGVRPVSCVCRCVCSACRSCVRLAFPARDPSACVRSCSCARVQTACCMRSLPCCCSAP